MFINHRKRVLKNGNKEKNGISLEKSQGNEKEVQKYDVVWFINRHREREYCFSLRFLEKLVWMETT